MKIKIEIKNKVVKICLAKGKMELDQITFMEQNNLSEKLLPAIDKLLRKNKLAPKDIKKMSVSSDTPESFTTSRIAKAVEKTWNWGSFLYKLAVPIILAPN